MLQCPVDFRPKRIYTMLNCLIYPVASVPGSGRAFPVQNCWLALRTASVIQPFNLSVLIAIMRVNCHQPLCLVNPSLSLVFTIRIQRPWELIAIKVSQHLCLSIPHLFVLLWMIELIYDIHCLIIDKWIPNPLFNDFGLLVLYEKGIVPWSCISKLTCLLIIIINYPYFSVFVILYRSDTS